MRYSEGPVLLPWEFLKRQVALLFQDMRLVFFCLALLVYAVASSPTPDNPSLIEALIAVLLVMAVGVVQPISFIMHIPRGPYPKWVFAAGCFLLYGVSVPFIMALAQGASLGSVLRDIVGFAFLCLPLFVWVFLKDRPVRQNFFVVLMLAIGLIFSVRVLLPHFFNIYQTAELLYLANSPLVLLSALFLFFMACQIIFNKLSLRHLGYAVLLFSLSSVALMAMFVDIQRASFMALGVSAVLLAGIGFVKAPFKIIAPVIVMGVLVFIFQAVVVGVVDTIILKTARVGVNMRAQEILAVWGAVAVSPIALLFGQGWGASFASPAVGGLHVTYTHSLLSYVFFKMGFMGLCLCLFYLFFIFEKLVRLSLRCPVKGNALMWPFLIPIFLYASHKSFDFGLLLTLILVMAEKARGSVPPKAMISQDVAVS